MSFDMQQFLQTFYEESFEGLDVMEHELLGLDVGAAEPETINTIFRAAHSIKGGSATFGLTAVGEFTHGLETLLDEMRDGRRQVTQASVDLLLTSVDCLREMLTALKESSEFDAARIAAVAQQIENLLKGHKPAQAAQDSAASVTPAPLSPVVTREVTAGWSIHFVPHLHLFKTGNDPIRMFRELANLGQLTVIKVDSDKLPSFGDLDPEESYLGWDLTLTGTITHKQIAEVFDWVDGDCDLEITPLTVAAQPEQTITSAQDEATLTTDSVAANSAAPTAQQTEQVNNREPLIALAKEPEERRAADRRQAAAPTVEAGSIRVSIDKIDALINMVGELVITQSMLNQLGEDFEMVRLAKLQEGLGQLERNTRELQESVMRIRMLPISFAFNRFPRMVHDLTQKLGKEVELKLSGEQTELDKTVMEKIGDPLVHLVRNSLDHGLECPDVRKKAGKSPVGLLHLNAYHQGGHIVIEVSDDGAGLNKQRITAKARERGLVGAEDVLTDEKIYELIFQAGFSTAEIVSDVSGRGVGMDVVKRNIKDLGGTIEVKSEEGIGTRFIIRLPLTLAILDGQLVRVGSDTFILPLVSIVESLQISRDNVNVIAGKSEVYKLRNEYLPIVRLYNVFGQTPDSTTIEGGLLVVVEGDGQRIGLFVDDLLGQQQVVIKSLETNFQRVEGISGATILGDGTVALILDISGVIQCSRRMPFTPSDYGAVIQQTAAA